jgi:hypothetical protein
MWLRRKMRCFAKQRAYDAAKAAELGVTVQSAKQAITRNAPTTEGGNPRAD